MGRFGLGGARGLMEGLLDQGQGVLVGEAVEDAAALVARGDGAAPAEPGQVLGDGGGAASGKLGELARGALGAAQKQDDADVHGAGQGAKVSAARSTSSSATRTPLFKGMFKR